eukprot:2176328-Pleurochrysis_carterae.AAC.1
MLLVCDLSSDPATVQHVSGGSHEEKPKVRKAEKLVKAKPGGLRRGWGWVRESGGARRRRRR